MIIFTMRMSTLPEKRKELMQTLLSIIEPIRKVKGLMSCNVYQDLENESGFKFVEEWETQEDLDSHFRSTTFSALLGARTLLSETPQVKIHTVSSTKGKEGIDHGRGEK